VSPQPSDAAVRRAATTTYDRNQVVIAGAGSGKTSLLVERILCQAVEQDLDAHELAAITFTEKAAAELRGRIEAGLVRLCALAGERDPTLDPAREADRACAHLRTRLPLVAIAKRSRELLEPLSSAAIGTIHGFCASLLRRYPLESGLDPDFIVDDETRYADLCRDLWDEFVRGPEGPDGDAASAWATLLERLDLPELESLAFALARFGAPARDALFLPDSRVCLGPLASEWIAEIDGLVGDPPAKGPQSYLCGAREVFRALRDEGIDEAKRVLERAFFESVRGPKGLLEGSAPTSNKEPEATGLADLVQKILKRLVRIDDALLRFAVERLAPFADRARADALARGIVPFEALLACTRDLLRDHPRVRRELGARYRILLLDEFQDTDPLQYEIVFFLAESAEGAPARDAFATQLAAGRLFIVGDPKQAIYRFRGADISAYHRAVRHVEASGGERLVLTTSFRAAPELLTPLGDLFPALLEAPASARARERDAYSGYDPLEAGRDRTGGPPRVELWTVGEVGAKAKAAEARRAEAEAIADWIAGEACERRLACGDVAILLRALSSLHVFTRALRDRGIPFALEGGREWSERPEGKQLLSLLRAIADPDDAAAVVGVLRSALGGVSDPELAAYAAATGPTARWSYLEAGVDAERFPNLARSFVLLRDRRRTASEQPLDAWLATLEEHAPLAALHAGAPDGAQRLVLLRAAIDAIVARARRDPTLDLPGLVGWLAKRPLREPGPDELGPTNAVRILTIHAAKGLEFPIVILPDLGRGRGRTDARHAALAQAVWRTGIDGLAVDTRAAISSGWFAHDREEQHHASAEEGRLLYVACTRARERLVLVHAPRGRREVDAPVCRLAPWSYPADGLPASAPSPHPGVVARSMRENELRRLAPSPVEPIDPRPALARTRAGVEILRARAVARFRSPSGLREERDERLDAMDAAPDARLPSARRDAGTVARHVGTVLHEVLEHWDFRDPASGRERIAAASLRSAAEGADPERVAEEARRVWDAFARSDLAHHLASVEVVGREMPLLHEDDEGVVWSGSIDLLYVDRDGRLVVADYKTDRRPDRETHERYRPQLELYGRAVARALPELAPPILELLYLRTGDRVRL
jgi:ATP-dependent helicase/nuclease subunit A